MALLKGHAYRLLPPKNHSYGLMGILTPRPEPWYMGRAGEVMTVDEATMVIFIS